MVVSNYSLRVIEEQFQDQVNRSLQRKLCDVFPDFYGGEKGLAIIRRQRHECNTWQIRTQQGIFIFMSLQALLNVDIKTMPEWVDFLSEFGGNGDRAVDMFFELLKHLTKR